MCSCGTKGRASLVTEEGAGLAEGAEAEVTGKCNGITTWPLH